MANKIIAYTIVGALFAGSLPACSSDNHDQSAEVDSAGELRLPLEATAASGNVYRLRAAQFNISGPESILVSPPDDSSTSFTTELDAGLYSIELLAGWQLWRMGPTEQLVEAELISPNPIVASVVSDTETVVTFQFRAGADVVVLGPGDLTVQIGVDEVTTCASDADCAAGEVCQSGVCVPAGLCGNAVIDPGESCDDGNVTSGDGCSAMCTVEIVCGNGVLEAPEQCDDGNFVNGDGCSAACTLEVTGHLVINEVDYDTIGVDTHEFVEIFNGTGSPISLAGVQLVFVNGTTASEYGRVDLLAASPELGSGQYLVVGTGVLLDTVPAGALTLPFALANDNIQNGAPDGIALVDISTGVVIDALAYEGNMPVSSIMGIPGGVSFGESPPMMDDSLAPRSLIRFPDGIDTDLPGDWLASLVPSPGAPNTP